MVMLNLDNGLSSVSVNPNGARLCIEKINLNFNSMQKTPNYSTSYCVRWVSLFLENRCKDERDHQEHQCECHHEWFTYEGTIDMQTYIGILKRHMLPSRQRFILESPWLFWQDNSRHMLTQSGFIDTEHVCLTVLSAVQICLLLKINDPTWRRESDNDWSLVSSKNEEHFPNRNT